VTSVSRSATLNRLIGLALVQPAVARRGQFTIRADRGIPVTVDVASLPFYDAAGERQKSPDRQRAPLAEGHA
jgi:glycine cleavage system aminomethyltransferase T